MKTFVKALIKCKYPVEISRNWLRPAVKLPTKTLRGWYSKWVMDSYTFHNNAQKAMLSQSRVFIALDGALECPGRDSPEFFGLFVNRMGESMDYWEGKVSPRVEMAIAFSDPEKFPYQYVKWKTRLNRYKTVKYVKIHYTWISLSVLLVLTNILSLLIVTT